MIELKKQLSEIEQEKHLKLASQGDYESQKKLFEHNLAMVIKIINENFYYLDTIEKEELFQVGSVGLWLAIQKYDYTYNTKLSTYAYKTILGEIKNYIRSNKLLKVPAPIQNLAIKINSLQKEYMIKGKELNEEELSILLNAPKKDIVLALNLKQKVSSLSQTVVKSNNNNDLCLVDVIEDSNTNVEREVEQKLALEEIENLVDNLEEQQKTIIKLLFGIGCASKTQKEIGKMLNLSKRQIEKIKNSALVNLKTIMLQNKNMIDEFDISQRIRKERKQIEFIPKTEQELFDQFKEYSKEQILKVINALNDENRKIVELRYGLNGNDSISYKEISQQLNIDYDNMYSRMNLIKKKITEMLEQGIIKKETIFDLYPGYTEEQILKTIESLNIQEKKIIELKYGLNGNNFISHKEIAKQLNIDSDIIRKKVYVIKKKIQKGLEGEILKNETIFDLFKEYTEKQVLGAIDSLKIDNKKIIELKYGLNGNEITNYETIAQQLNIDLDNVRRRIYTIKSQIQERLENGKFKRETIFDLYSEYTKEQIIEAISKLKGYNKTIIEMKYGLNGYNITETKDIAQQFNITPVLLNSKLWSIYNQIERRLKKEKYNKENLFKLYPEYTKEQILGAIDSLKKDNKIIIEMKYGLNGYDITETKDIAEAFNSNTQKINTKIHSIYNQIENRLQKGIFKKETIFDLFKEYTEEQVLGAIDSLKNYNKTIIEMKYGLNGYNITEIKDIANKLNVNERNICITVYSAEKQIQERLEKGKFKRETIFDLYPKYTEEQVLNAINTLKRVNKQIIELKYGLNGNEYNNYEEISKQLNIDIEKVRGRMYIIKKQIQERLERKSKNFNNNEIKVLISMIDDPIEQAVLLLRLGCINNKYYKENEISKILNINENDIKSIISNGLLKISSLSNENQKVKK